MPRPWRGRAGRACNLVANARSVGFYEACGFQTVRKVETAFNPGWEMVKALTLGA